MKNLFSFLIILWFCLASWNLTLAGEYIRVKRVDDGDTILLNNGIRIRYIGINTPEIAHNGKKAEPLSHQAWQFNKKLVLKNEIRLEYDRELKDHFGRSLAYVFKKDGTFVNAKLIQHGYAYYYPHRMNQKYGGYLLRLQRSAMEKKVGVWGSISKESNGQRYVGNKKSRRFHLFSCKFGKKTGMKNRIILKTKWDAYWKGFAPCKKCQ